MNSLLRLVWFDVAAPLWRTRNDIMHKNDNKHREQENATPTEKITWYVTHRHELLSHQDEFLAAVDVSTLHRLRRDTKREWVRHLDTVREAFAVECRQRASGQNVITRYLVPRLRPGTEDD